MGLSDEPPPCLHYIWDWFLDLTYDRHTGMGIGYIPSSEYESWARLNRVELSYSELAVLKGLDRAYVEYQASKTPQSGKTPDVVSAQPMTPQIFDSLFK